MQSAWERMIVYSSLALNFVERSYSANEESVWQLCEALGNTFQIVTAHPEVVELN